MTGTSFIGISFITNMEPLFGRKTKKDVGAYPMRHSSEPLEKLGE